MTELAANHHEVHEGPLGPPSLEPLTMRWCWCRGGTVEWRWRAASRSSHLGNSEFCEAVVGLGSLAEGELCRTEVPSGV